MFAFSLNKIPPLFNDSSRRQFAISLHHRWYAASVDRVKSNMPDGFVLAGGASRRMGRDKALLDFAGGTMIASVAKSIAPFAASVTIIGPPERYRQTGLPVVADRRPGCGPLAGIETAFAESASDWILIAACDMPLIEPEVLESLWRSVRDDAQAVWPRTPDGRVHPLCALYHRRAAARVTAALDAGRFKVRDAFDPGAVVLVGVPEIDNVNTPEEWAAFQTRRTDC